MNRNAVLAKQLLEVLNAPRPGHFDPHFLTQVPFQKASATLARVRQRMGPAKVALATLEPGIWTVQTATHEYQLRAVFGADHRLTGLQLAPPRAASALPWSLTWWLPFLPWLLIFLPLAGVWSAWHEATVWGWLLTVPSLTALAALLLAINVWPQTAAGLRWLTWIALALLLASGARLLSLPTGEAPGVSTLITTGGVLVLLLVPLILGLLGRRRPVGPVALGRVLAGGTFVVAQGGGSRVINYHMAYPHMRYAVDFIGTSPNGRHARGWRPADPSRYAIFGAAVLAPLDGVIVHLQDGRPDLQVPDADPLRAAGNFVVLQCALSNGRDVQILLAHLLCGSLQVRAGESVHVGQPLARVGNSGNSSEPHLHLGVNTGTTPGQPLSGQGVAFMVDGQFPVRGLIFRG